MNWDSPFTTKFFMVAASVVLVAGCVATHMYQTPALSAPAQTAAVAVSDGEMRDAVASPALPMGASAGWFAATGAGALSRAAHAPSLRNALKPVLPPRPTSGRAVFSGQRVIVESASSGIPEPSFSAAR
jgi:hypothetical protein